MIASLHALLDGIIDYAGLFPPARLPLPEAAGNFVRYQPHPQAFMLSRFICPATRLPALAELPAPHGGWRLSVIVPGDDDPSTWQANLESAVAGIGAFAAAVVEPVDADALELRLPVGRDATPCLEAVGTRAPRAHAYFEIDLADDVTARLAEIARYNDRRPDGTPAARAKIRTGGVEAHMFPSCAAVADFISGCRAAGVALKATAGLHHPVRHHHAAVQADMHGFLNVFVAGILVHAGAADPAVMLEVLEERDPTAFEFDPDGLGWRGQRADVAAITAARRTFITGYGSCSFEEPVDDLAALNLL